MIYSPLEMLVKQDIVYIHLYKTNLANINFQETNFYVSIQSECNNKYLHSLRVVSLGFLLSLVLFQNSLPLVTLRYHISYCAFIKFSHHFQQFYFQHITRSVTECPPRHSRRNKYIFVNFPTRYHHFSAYYQHSNILLFLKPDGNSLKMTQIYTYYTENVQ